MTLTREGRKEMSFAARPIRVLHVVGGMNRGGVETWLMHLLRRVDRGRLQMDFLVQTDAPCAYDAEIRDLGARIISCPEPRRPWTHARNLSQILPHIRPIRRGP